MSNALDHTALCELYREIREDGSRGHSVEVSRSLLD